VSDELEKHYTVSQLAKMLNVKPYTIRRYIHDGVITAVVLPGGRGEFRISESEAKRIVNNTYGSSK
jgi:excisionase family DNA binding protein